LPLTCFAVLALAVTAVAGYRSPLRAESAPAEHGTFRLHKFMQPIGVETYDVTRDGDALVVASTFEFSDRGTKVPLTATLRAKADYTPVHFEIKGKTSRSSSIDSSLDVGPAGAAVTENGASRTETLPERFVVSGGYAPLAMQMAMVRYWLGHGRPARLRAVPVGDVRIVDRGADTFAVGGRDVVLRRYSVDGLKWGREWLWVDGEERLAAVVTTDAEFDHFEGVRDDLEPALPEFVARAAIDGMAQLAEVSKGIAPTRRGDLAVVGATLVDGTGKAPVADAVVVVHDGRIVAAGPRSAVAVPKRATVVDGRGKWLVPGLWDMHAHFEQVEWGPVYLAAGVTTARDCGNEFEFITAARDAVEAGRGLGPRLVLAGVVDGDGPASLGVDRINRPEDVGPVVTRYKRAGFRQIKIYSSIKPELVPLIAAEAHRQGMTVTGHVPTGMNAIEGIEAGMDQINHINYVWDLVLPLSKLRSMSPADAVTAIRAVDFGSPEAQRAIRELADRHTVVDPTIALYQWLWHPASVPFATIEPGAAKLPPELAGPINGVGVPPERAEFFAALQAKGLELVAALHRAGVPVVAGTDQAIPGYSLHREIELYQKAGLTPMEALESATIVPARAVGLDRELGTIEAGKLADMLLVDADPLADVANLRKIDRVIARGRVFEPAPLWRAAGFTP
jgi:imidazolonepropionase-like amidohydrolase